MAMMYADGGAEKKKRAQMSCSIATFIRNTDPELYNMFEDTCLVGALTSAFRVNGITFINPVKGSTLRKELERLYEEDREQLEKSLRSLILQDVFHNASDFKRSEQDIPNRLNRSVPLIEASGNKVKLGNTSSPLTIIKSAEFAPFTGRRNIAIWDVSEGNSFLDDSKFIMSKGMFNQKKRTDGRERGPVDGAGEAYAVDSAASRMEFFKSILMMSLVSGTGSAYKAIVDDIYLCMFTATDENPGKPTAEDLQVAAMVAGGPPLATLYTLIQPFKTSGKHKYLINRAVIEMLKKHFSSPLGLSHKHAVLLDGKVTKARAEAVGASLGELKVDEAQGLDKMDALFNGLDAIKDRIPGAAAFADQGGFGTFMRWLMEVRMKCESIKDIACAPEHASGARDYICDILSTYPADDFAAEIRISRKYMLESGYATSTLASMTSTLTKSMAPEAHGITGGGETDEIDKMLNALETV